MSTRPSILCLLRIAPVANGHGGSQRAWRLVEGLCRIGRVHVVLLHRPADTDLDPAALAPLRLLVETVAVVAVPEWDSIGQRRPALPWSLAVWLDWLRLGSGEAPRLSARALATIAAQMSARSFDLVVAGRLPCAVIADRLIAAGHLRAGPKLVDLDDVLSVFKREQRRAQTTGPLASLLCRLDIAAVERAERSLRGWDAVALCSDDDVARMAAVLPGTPVIKLPNVVDRPLLPPTTGAPFRLLFVGHLSFPPNRHGLERFVADGWPLVRAARPDAVLAVVGMTPPEALRRRLAAVPGLTLHADVTSVEPFYRAADAVVCPIFFGGGTRIKLLEAMAHGRAIVATTAGAAGLDLVPGRHALIADTMPALAAALLRLAGDPALREGLAAEARALQQAQFARPAFERALDAMVAAVWSRPAR